LCFFWSMCFGPFSESVNVHQEWAPSARLGRMPANSRGRVPECSAEGSMLSRPRRDCSPGMSASGAATAWHPGDEQQGSSGGAALILGSHADLHADLFLECVVRLVENGDAQEGIMASVELTSSHAMWDFKVMRKSDAGQVVVFWRGNRAVVITLTKKR